MTTDDPLEAELRDLTGPHAAHVIGQHAARPEHPPTFTIRPAGEDEPVTVALHSLGDCAVCSVRILAGAFVVPHPSDAGPDQWAHEWCAHPGKPTRPALNADQTRNRS